MTNDNSLTRAINDLPRKIEISIRKIEKLFHLNFARSFSIPPQNYDVAL